MPILGVVGSNKIYPTQDTMRRLRQEAAQQGEVVGKVRTEEGLLEAVAASVSDDELEAACNAVLGRGMCSREEAIKSLKDKGVDVTE